MQQQLTQSEVKFRNSLRSESQNKAFRTNAEHELNEIRKFLQNLIHDLGNVVDAIQVAEKLIKGQLIQFRRHIQFFVYVPDPQTYIGERILKEIEIWIIILVVFNSQCNRQNKLDEFVYLNIEEQMEKHIKSEKSAEMIQKRANKIMERLKVKEQQETNEVALQPIQEQISREIQCPSMQKEIIADDDPLPNDQKKEQQTYEPKVKAHEVETIGQVPDITPKKALQSSFKKVQSRSNRRVQFQDDKENNCMLVQKAQKLQEDEKFQQELNILIDKKLNEFEQEPKGKTTFTDKIFSMLHLSSKKKVCHQDQITVFYNLEQRELPNFIFANVESVILEDIKGNRSHSIVKLSIDNHPELISNGLYAMVEMKKECNSQKHFEDWIMYQNFVTSNFQQEYKILIPYNQYKL